nr:PREDICTED: uncharacterized protein LOC104154072 [Struthio camelus australis]
MALRELQGVQIPGFRGNGAGLRRAWQLPAVSLRSGLSRRSSAGFRKGCRTPPQPSLPAMSCRLRSPRRYPKLGGSERCCGSGPEGFPQPNGPAVPCCAVGQPEGSGTAWLLEERRYSTEALGATKCIEETDTPERLCPRKGCHGCAVRLRQDGVEACERGLPCELPSAAPSRFPAGLHKQSGTAVGTTSVCLQLNDFFFTGCELKADKEYQFKVDDEENEHQLSLRTVTLGAGAKDELHVVEAEALDYEGNPIKVILASLKMSVQPTVSLGGFEITPPVVLRLKCGSGPVYVSGQHLVALEEEPESDDEEDDTKIVNTSTKRPASGGGAKTPQKKAKLSEDDDDDDEDEDDDDEYVFLF